MTSNRMPPTKRSRTGPAAAAAAAPADPPPAGQQLGELHTACTAELAAPGGVWPAPAPDGAAAIRRLGMAALLLDRLAPPVLAGAKLTDLLGVAGSWVDGGARGRARVEGRRVARLPAGPGRAAAEAALYAPGWAGEDWMETGDRAGESLRQAPAPRHSPCTLFRSPRRLAK